MLFTRARLLVGTIGFLLAFFLVAFWSYTNAHDLFSFQTLGVLQRFTFVVCPPAISLMATEHLGLVGTIIIIVIVAAQNFIIYFLAAAFLSLLWRKFKRAVPTESTKGGSAVDREGTQENGSSHKNWRYFALVGTGFLLLIGVSVGLTNFVISFGWSWYYLPGSVAVLGASLICFSAAGRFKRVPRRT